MNVYKTVIEIRKKKSIIKNSIKSQIMINKHYNDKIKKIKEDLLEDYKEVLNTNKMLKFKYAIFAKIIWYILFII